MMRRQFFVLVLFCFVYGPLAQAAKPIKDSRCFSMTPITNFDDSTCSAVKVRIQFKDCSLGSSTENPVEAYAHFDCHAKPPHLKYWYQNSMLFGDLKKTSDSYEVVKTYGYRYGKEPPPDKEVTLNTPVVLPPVTTAGVEAAASAAENDALKAKALAELAKPTETVEAVPSPSAAPPVTGAPPVTALPVAVSTPTPAPSAEPSALTPAGKSLLTALSKIQVGASLVAYYAYNLNQPQATVFPAPYGNSPAGNNKYLQPSSYHDQPTLSFAKVSLYEDAAPVGFHIDLGFGPLADTVAGSGSDQSTRNILQGYLAYRFPFGLEIDAGKMFSHMGFENVDPTLNWNFSYSLLYFKLTPFWYSGVRATLPVGDRVGLGVYYNNGFNNFYQNHRTRDIGAQIRVAPIDNLKIFLNYESGDQGITSTDIRTTYEGIALYSPLECLKIAVDYAISLENNALNPNNVQASSIATSVNFNVWNHVYIVPRYEIYNDAGVSYGTLAPGGELINSGTLGIGYRPDDNLRLQVEYRQDQSTQQSFSNSQGTLPSQQVVLLSGMVTY